MNAQVAAMVMPSTSITMDPGRMDTLLADVHADDKIIFVNIMSTIDTLRPYKLVHSYKVISTKKGYDLVGQLRDQKQKDDEGCNTSDIIISVQDLDVIVNMNPSRIATCIVQIPSTSTPQLVVRVLRSDQAIVYNDIQISHVKRKARWW
jgi:hypothetical protein